VYPYEHGDWPGAALHDASRRAVVAGELMDITPRYVGSHAPRVLIVGNGTERAMPFMPYEDTDSNYMMAELDDWRQIGLVNCHRPEFPHEPERLRELWFALGKPTIVSFGGTASATLNSMVLNHNDYGPLHKFKQLPKGSLREIIRRHL
jgi:hypothetical protein